MSDPNRWLDDDATSSEVRSLLSSAARTPGIPRDDDAALRSAMEKIAAGTLATSTLGTSIVAKLAAAIVVVAIGGGIAFWALHGPQPPSRAAQPHAIADRSVVSSPPDPVTPTSPISAGADRLGAATGTQPQGLSHVEAAPQPARRAEAAAHLERSRAAGGNDPDVGRDAGVAVEATTGASGSPTIPAAAAPADPLAVEFQYIGRARTLRTSDPAQALAELEEHERLFPNGALAPERDYLIVDVLRRLGRTGDARTRAQEFLQRHAGSPYAPIVQRTLDAL